MMYKSVAVFTYISVAVFVCQEYSSIYKYAVIVNGAIFNNDTDGTP